MNVNNIGTTHRLDTVNGSNLTYGYPLANKKVFAKKCILHKSARELYSNTRLEDEKLAKANRIKIANSQYLGSQRYYRDKNKQNLS